MNKTRKPRGVYATEEGRQKLAQAKAAKRDDNKPFTYEDIATAANVDTRTVRKFFTGEAGVDKDSAYAIVKALGLPSNVPASVMVSHLMSISFILAVKSYLPLSYLLTQLDIGELRTDFIGLETLLDAFQ